MTEPTPPTARRELGNLLRRLRQDRDLGLDEVARQVGLTQGFLSRVERGLRGIGDDKAERLNQFYALPARTRDNVRQLARIGRGKTWWETSPMERATREFIGFEQVATAIMSYGSIVPGLLQTRPYCEAMVERTAAGSAIGNTTDTIEMRMRRQGVLDQDDPPWVWAILDESALHRKIGGQAVMHDQLTTLIAATDRARVSIRILPFSAGAHLGMDSRFTIVSTAEDHAAALVYVEGLSGAWSLYQDSELGRYSAAWNRLAALALPDGDSKSLIRRVVA